MTGLPVNLADLLAECHARGIRLLVAGDGGLEIDAPRAALTPELLDRLKAYKADLLALLRPMPDAAPAGIVAEAAFDPEATDTVVDPLAGNPFAGWVRRPDCRGRMGWEAPGLPESRRWWARCHTPSPTPQDCASCVMGGPVDALSSGQSTRTGAPRGLWRGVAEGQPALPSFAPACKSKHGC